MKDILEIFAILGIWFFLTRYLFPKIGVPT